jgi:ArsR family transcriptional regulator, arsenate/arsenite/antimonite-responsive transcriptional repressor
VSHLAAIRRATLAGAAGLDELQQDDRLLASSISYSIAISIVVDTLTVISTSVNISFVKLIQTIDAACCPQVLASPIGDEEATKFASALRVLADPARLRLLNLIGANPDGEACVCNLTAPLGLSQPTVSHHLKVLTEAGLLGREKRGRWVYYRVLPEPIALLRDALAAPQREGGSVERAS